jgi:hypothetical protein
MEVVYGLSKGLPREINVIAGYAMLNCYLNDGHQVTCEHVRSVVTEYSFEGVTEAPPQEESSDSRSQVVQPLKVATKAETTKSAGRFGVGRWSSKAVLSAIAALVVLAAITIGMLRDNPPEKGGGRRVESVPSPTGALAAAPGEESFGTEPDPSPATEEAGSAKSHLDRTFSPIDAEPHLPVIKVDRVLSDEPNQRVTVQIASMLDQELAEISLAKASARTDMPGAVETVPVGDTTWHLVLLGCFRSVEEAEIAVQPMLPILKEQAVTEVRIKPAPGWLEESLIKRQ